MKRNGTQGGGAATETNRYDGPEGTMTGQGAVIALLVTYL